MQIPKIAAVFCALMLAATVVLAEDNAEQAAARAALVAKLFDMSAESAPTNYAQPAPPVTAPAFTTTTVVKPSVKVDNAVMHPINQKAAPVYQPVPRIDIGGNYRVLNTPHNAQIETPPLNWTKTPPARNVPSSISQKPMATQSTATKTQSVMPTAVSSEYIPMVAPATPLAAGKQQTLLDLLNKYKADQITPEEYHRQRAAIIGGM